MTEKDGLPVTDTPFGGVVDEGQRPGMPICTCGHPQDLHAGPGDTCWKLKCKCEGFVRRSPDAP